MVNWVEVGACLGYFACLGMLILVYYAFKGWEMLTSAPEIDTKAVVQEIYKQEPARITQMASVQARAENTGNKEISSDLLENSPLTLVLDFLSEDTLEYLQEHPEALPGILKKWLPLIEKFSNTPLGQTLLGGIQGQEPQEIQTDF